MDRSSFAATIKAKYPDYASVPDDDLVTRILTKYPEYASHVDDDGDLASTARARQARIAAHQDFPVGTDMTDHSIGVGDVAGAVGRGAAHLVGIPTSREEWKQAGVDALANATTAGMYGGVKQGVGMVRDLTAPARAAASGRAPTFAESAGVVPMVGHSVTAITAPARATMSGRAPSNEENLGAIESGTTAIGALAAPAITKAAGAVTDTEATTASRAARSDELLAKARSKIAKVIDPAGTAPDIADRAAQHIIDNHARVRTPADIAKYADDQIAAADVATPVGTAPYAIRRSPIMTELNATLDRTKSNYRAARAAAADHAAVVNRIKELAPHELIEVRPKDGGVSRMQQLYTEFEPYIDDPSATPMQQAAARKIVELVREHPDVATAHDSQQMWRQVKRMVTPEEATAASGDITDRIISAVKRPLIRRAVEGVAGSVLGGSPLTGLAVAGADAAISKGVNYLRSPEYALGRAGKSVTAADALASGNHQGLGLELDARTLSTAIAANAMQSQQYRDWTPQDQQQFGRAIMQGDHGTAASISSSASQRQASVSDPAYGAVAHIPDHGVADAMNSGGMVYVDPDGKATPIDTSAATIQAGGPFVADAQPSVPNTGRDPNRDLAASDRIVDEYEFVPNPPPELQQVQVLRGRVGDINRQIDALYSQAEPLIGKPNLTPAEQQRYNSILAQQDKLVATLDIANKNLSQALDRLQAKKPQHENDALVRSTPLHDILPESWKTARDAWGGSARGGVVNPAKPTVQGGYGYSEDLGKTHLPDLATPDGTIVRPSPDRKSITNFSDRRNIPNTILTGRDASNNPFVILHEYAHGGWEKDLTPEMQRKWEVLNRKYDAIGRSPAGSQYADAAVPNSMLNVPDKWHTMQSLLAAYVMDPTMLKSKYPDIYDFFREMYGGREFVQTRGATGGGGSGSGSGGGSMGGSHLKQLVPG